MALLDDPRVRLPAREPRWPGASDDALIRGASTGADGAFEEIFSRYHGPLVRYCRGILLDEHLAQDAAQNALASALRAFQGGTAQPRVLGPWLYRIAQREAIDLARRRRQDAAARLQPGADGEDALLSVAAPNDERVRERLRDLVGDLSRLPLRQRSALLLRELSGLDYAGIALALDTTPAAARQSVLEARSALVDAGAGRQDSCGDIRALLDSGDRRHRRSRRLRAHLDDCAGCRAFAASLDTRGRDLALLFPLAPAVAGGGGALAAITGGSIAAGGASVAAGGAGVAAGGWSLGIGGGIGAAKCALACTAALVGVGAVTEQAVVHHTRPEPKVRVVAQAPQPERTAPAHASAPAPSATAITTPAVAPTRGGAKPSTAPPRAPRRPKADHGGSTKPSATTTGATTPTTAATTPVTTPPATTTPAVVPAATQARPKSGAEVVAAVQTKAKEAVQELTSKTQVAVKQVVEDTLTRVTGTVTSLQDTIQKVTNTALSGVQAQLQGIRNLFPKPASGQPAGGSTAPSGTTTTP